MPSSPTRQAIEIPRELFHALDQAAEKADMPTSALAALWLWEHLHAMSRVPGSPAEGISVERPYRFGPEMYPRRKRKEG